MSRRCLNCGTLFEGKYCPECGQAADTGRFTAAGAAKSLAATLSGGESTFFTTALQLFYRPGHLVREYLLGKRAQYFRPVQMMLFLVTIFVLLSYIIDSSYSPFDILRSAGIENNVHSSSLEKAIGYVAGLLANKVTFSLISAVVCVLPFRFLFRKRTVARFDGESMGLNTAEHFYALVYVACQNMLLSIVMMPLSLIGGMSGHLRVISLFAPIVFALWTYCQIFRTRKVLTSIQVLASVILMFASLSAVIILVFGLFYGYDAVAA